MGRSPGPVGRGCSLGWESGAERAQPTKRPLFGRGNSAKAVQATAVDSAASLSRVLDMPLLCRVSADVSISQEG